jgi:hypothetical protein
MSHRGFHVFGTIWDKSSVRHLKDCINIASNLWSWPFMCISAEVKNGWSCTSTPLPYSFMARTEVAGQWRSKSSVLPGDAAGSLVQVSFLSCLWAVMGCPGRCRLSVRWSCYSRRHDKRDTQYLGFVFAGSRIYTSVRIPPIWLGIKWFYCA